MHPVFYDQTPPEQRSRLTIFFRYITSIPLFVVGAFYAIGALLAVFAAWFVLVFTGRWPEGLYDFVAGFVRFASRLMAYFLCIVDEYPPFGLGEHPDYPVRIVIAPPKPEYSRVKVLLRILLIIPVYIVMYVMQIWLYVVSIVLWFSGVFLGRTSPGLTEAMRLPMAYYTRAQAYIFLVTEDFPPFEPGTPPEITTAPEPSPIGLS